MERGYVLKLSRLLMRLHGLVGWKLEIAETPGFYGLCEKSKKKISLSDDFVKHCKPPQLVELMLHEIAHALVGIRHGHDKTWKAKCEELGAKPTAQVDICVPERYQAICSICRRFYTRTRKSTSPSCCTCPTKPLIEFVDVSKMKDPKRKGYKNYG